MLQWRAYWPMSPKGNADRARLWPALRALVEAALGAAEVPACALEAFVYPVLEAGTVGKPETRLEMRRAGTEGVRTCRCRGLPYNYKKNSRALYYRSHNLVHP